MGCDHTTDEAPVTHDKRASPSSRTPLPRRPGKEALLSPSGFCRGACSRWSMFTAGAAQGPWHDVSAREWRCRVRVPQPPFGRGAGARPGVEHKNVAASPSHMPMLHTMFYHGHPARMLAWRGTALHRARRRPAPCTTHTPAQQHEAFFRLQVPGLRHVARTTR